MPLWTTTDVFAPGIALGHVVGRLGCLMAGCCFGRPTSVPWAITFHDPVAAAERRHAARRAAPPDAALRGRRRAADPRRCCWRPNAAAGRFPDGRSGRYMLLYGVSRFVIEFYRGDSRGLVFDVLSTSQFVSVDPRAARDRDARPAQPAPGSVARSRRRRSVARARERRPLEHHRRRRRPTTSTTASGSTRFLAGAPARPIALPDPAADQGRPRHRPGRAATREHARSRAGQTVHDRRCRPRPPTLRSPRICRSPSSTRTPTSSSSTSRPEWSSTRRPDTPAARSSTRCSTMWTT